jgi:hypothetical protein
MMDHQKVRIPNITVAEVDEAKRLRFAGLTNKEIAQVMKTSPGRVARMLRLEEEYGTEVFAHA